jgi:hypothetical protein
MRPPAPPRPQGATIVLTILTALFVVSPLLFFAGLTFTSGSQDDSFTGVCLAAAGLVLFFLPPQLGFILAATSRWLLMKLLFGLMILANIAGILWWVRWR